MTDATMQKSLGAVFHAVARMASPRDATEEHHHAQTLAMVALIDFAYFEPGFFTALLKHQTRDYASDTELPTMREMWRDLVTRYPLEQIQAEQVEA